MPQVATTQEPPILPCKLDDIDIDNDNLIDICDIQGLNEIRNNLYGEGTKNQGCLSACNGYELMSNLDFFDGKSYRDYSADEFDNWLPAESFYGIFEGNGHTISNLTIDRSNTNYVGLFEEIKASAKINNVKLLNVDISGGNYVGGLAGSNAGEIINSCIINTNADTKIEGQRFVGGLIGDNGGTITNSCTMVEVQGYEHIGGLVGRGDRGIIRNSHTTTTVVGSNEIGGLVGVNNSTIIGSYAVANIKGVKIRFNQSSDLGGLVGLNYLNAKIINSHVIGRVAGFDFVGGLAGHNFGTIINSHAKSKVQGDSEVGGLVGRNKSGTIQNSYATGDVDGEEIDLGGLVGENFGGKIINSYAIGNVASSTINYVIGSLVGRNDGGTIRNTYATGNIKGEKRQNINGLVGINDNGSILYSYVKDKLQLVGRNDNDGKIIASFISNMRSLQQPTAPGSTATEVYYLWSENDWFFGTKKQYPTLRHTGGSDTAMPACNKSSELPNCDSLLIGQQFHLDRVFIYTNIKVLLEGIFQ